MARKLIENIIDGKERAFYSSFDVDFKNITIDGPEDGESAFKESRNFSIENSTFNLRYPFWHDDNIEVKLCSFNETCRAAFWYTKNAKLHKCVMKGVKAFRECSNLDISFCNIDSEEPFWRTPNIDVHNSQINGFYAFFQCNNIHMDDCKFTGKYSFQYTKDVEIEDSTLDTKDAFWHSENVTCRNCVIKGEYLGWYSKNLTLINCEITGTQPLCYCEGLKIINCTMNGCDLAFEYSEVDALIVGKVKSIKNPLRGSVTLEKCEEFIVDENDRSDGGFTLIEVK